MLILLPPSETKKVATTGHAFEMNELSFPELSAARHRVLEELQEISRHPEALKLLGVGASLEEEVRRNLELHEASAAPAYEIYNGVLYDALSMSSLGPKAKQRVVSSVVVVSALWGAVGFGDRIPAYRLSMGTKLGRIGNLSSYWRSEMKESMDRRAEGQLIIDCRSSSYAAAWKAPLEQTVSIGVKQWHDGKLKVITHAAKLTRGELVRELATSRRKEPTTPKELLALVKTVWPDSTLEPATSKVEHKIHIVLPAAE
ncbi:YaaA family protein [Neomicrococcus lactis]|uniref:YaaA family protein n=1 Tax=Neomicrococcus lactis TaxID=732241 RepID=UPI002300EE08|nr:peroxide stress protein YaaA [Neomicrococcus lactis]